MIHIRKLMAFTLTLLAGACALPSGVRADDIDIFLGAQSNTVNAPNIIFLLDDTDNWSANDPVWGEANGVAELAAIQAQLKKITLTSPANVGLAMLNSNSGTAIGQVGGGFIRFAIRDMTVSSNRTALTNLLGDISGNINHEKLTGQKTKDEEAAFYEIYKYLSGLTPYTGLYQAGDPLNQYVDIFGNTNATDTGFNELKSVPSLPLPGNVWAIAPVNETIQGNVVTLGNYISPINTNNPCAATYIIYISNTSAASKGVSPGLLQYEASGPNVGPNLPATTYDTALDEWTYFLRTNGVVVPAGSNNGAVITYVLDAYKEAAPGPASDYSASLKAAADMGGGKYFAVTNPTAVSAALSIIFSEIQSVNSTFASASLPVNTTNRSQNLNQVFIPMFRPDPQSGPLWMGNLKQYQLISLSGSIDLGDNSSPPINAVNPLTGFVTPCAQSFWTTDSGTYWQSDIFDNPMAKGTCPKNLTGYSKWSDDPDGPLVEKGGVAEVIRKGNSPPGTNTTPTWAVNRTIYTLNGLSSLNLQNFTKTTLGGTNQPLANFMMGQDVNDENANGNTTEARPSLHGDEIHSRPLPVDYTGATGVVVYYGSNDGMLRAVNASTGAELWAFVAPEFYTSTTQFTRLQTDSPQISYPNMPTGITPTPIPKDYYFDGSIGQYQTANNSSVWIFPSMRRGGRTVYAFDVTTPTSPSVKWKIGCPYPEGNDTGCTTGMSATTKASGIGQTWSTPIVATSVLGYTGPVVIMGGGYDTCEDANTAALTVVTPPATTPPCASLEYGAAVYVIDANTGAIVSTFPTTRSVVGDVALIAVANAGVIDHAYAADTGGNIYRIDFASSVSNWHIYKVAYTTGAGRKFLFAPALLSAKGGYVYVALGSGDREHPLQSEYPYGGVTNRFYVYVDNLASTGVTNLDGPLMYDYTTGGSVGTTTNCSTAGVLPGAGMNGWFMNLNQYGTGEQTVSTALIAGGAVAFSTNRPIASVAGTCSNLGQALGYWVNLFNASGAIGVPGATCGGSRSSVFVGGGLPPSPVLANVVVNGQAMTVTIGTAQLSGGVSSPISPQQVKPNIVPTRKKLYWKSSGEN
jgi:type IV pilus assembly protein PilY1